MITRWQPSDTNEQAQADPESNVVTYEYVLGAVLKAKGSTLQFQGDALRVLRMHLLRTS